MPSSTRPRLELSLPKIVAGALAAASAAVASSWLGVAGTVFGAVVVSVVATVGTALYAHSLERSRHVIKETIPVLATRVRADRDPADGPETIELSASTTTAAIAARRPISWPTVAVSCVATLVLGLGLLTGLEAVLGESASTLTGSGSGSGTTVGSLVGGGSSRDTSDPTQPERPSTTSPATSPPTSTTPTTTTPTTPTTTPTTPTTTAPTTPTTTAPTSTDPTSTTPTSTMPSSTGPTEPPPVG